MPLIEQTVRNNPGLPVFRAALMRAKSVGDHKDELSQLLDVELGTNFQMPEDLQWSTAHVNWAEAAVRCGHRTAADRLYELLRPWHAQFATTHITVSGSVAHYLGSLAHSLGRYDEADQWFAEALVCHEGLQAPYFVALTQTAWAVLLSDRNQPGDAERARALIDAALPVATERGYGYIERDARSLLEIMG
jgi:tetratricopeptide (TPR) repeat protein